MILTDTGPLIALLDKRDDLHQPCLEALAQLPAAPLLTTWPCLTEAMHILGAAGGYRYQAMLWRLIEDEKVQVRDLRTADIERMNALMKKYQDTPMDFADASLVAVADSLKLKRIFTIDSDFLVYRLSNGSGFEIIP